MKSDRVAADSADARAMWNAAAPVNYTEAASRRCAPMKKCNVKAAQAAHRDVIRREWRAAVRTDPSSWYCR